MPKADEQFSSIKQLTKAFQELHRSQVAFQEQTKKDHAEQLELCAQLRAHNKKATEELRAHNKKATEELRAHNKKAAEELRTSITKINADVNSFSVYSYAEQINRIDDLRHETLVKKLDEIKMIIENKYR